MTLPGIYFVDRPPPAPGLSTRADIAMFVGMVARTLLPVPPMLRTFLDERGWTHGLTEGRMNTLLNLPVAVESWSEFTALFAWDKRPYDRNSPIMIPTHLGLAVRSFFEQGGQKAIIVRTGDPISLIDSSMNADDFSAAKRHLFDWPTASADASPPGMPPDAASRVPILPGLINAAHRPDPGVRSSWQGAGAIFGVEDAAMLLVPDLVDLCAGAPVSMPDVPTPSAPSESFKPCATVLPNDLFDAPQVQPPYRAPRLDKAGFAAWADATRHLLDMLGTPKGASHRRDVMLIASAPLPLAQSGFGGGAETNPLRVLGERGAVITGQSLMSSSYIGNARLQLAYPWVGTQASTACPEAVEAPEGIFAGILARSALSQGAFRSVAGQPVYGAQFLLPMLGKGHLAATLPYSDARGSGWLGDRISLIGEARGRVQMLSDSTLSESASWRPGGISRLMGIILRCARYLGDDLTFEPSGPTLWNGVRSAIEAMLNTLRDAGAFAGQTQDECFTVRCDRTTMTQADLDAGRAIATISFAPAFPVERITVTLDLTGMPSQQMQRAA